MPKQKSKPKKKAKPKVVVTYSIAQPCSSTDFTSKFKTDDWEAYESLAELIEGGKAPAGAIYQLRGVFPQGGGAKKPALYSGKDGKGNTIKGVELKPHGGKVNHGRVFIGWNEGTGVVKCKCFAAHADNAGKEATDIGNACAAAQFVDYGDYESQSMVGYPLDYNYQYAYQNNIDSALVAPFAIILAIICICLLAAITCACGAIFGAYASYVVGNKTENKTALRSEYEQV
eukprot:171957_1